jgi:hypothetical protein
MNSLFSDLLSLLRTDAVMPKFEYAVIAAIKLLDRERVMRRNSRRDAAYPEMGPVLPEHIIIVCEMFCVHSEA